jgi:hypothetical protein
MHTYIHTYDPAYARVTPADETCFPSPGSNSSPKTHDPTQEGVPCMDAYIHTYIHAYDLAYARVTPAYEA